jgi:hypothetical protein
MGSAEAPCSEIVGWTWQSLVSIKKELNEDSGVIRFEGSGFPSFKGGRTSDVSFKNRQGPDINVGGGAESFDCPRKSLVSVKEGLDGDFVVTGFRESETSLLGGE